MSRGQVIGRALQKVLPKSSNYHVLVSLIKMITTKTPSYFLCRKNIRILQVQSQMDLYKKSHSLAVVGKAQKPVRKDSSGTLQYIPGLKNISFHVNKRWIRCIFPYFNGTLLETATSKHNLYHGFFI